MARNHSYMKNSYPGIQLSSERVGFCNEFVKLIILLQLFIGYLFVFNKQELH